MTVEAAFIITYVNVVIISFLVCAFLYHDKCQAKAAACMMVLDYGRVKEPDLSLLFLTDKNKVSGKDSGWYRQYYISLNNRYESLIFEKLFNFRIKESAVCYGTDPAETLRFFRVFKDEYMGKGEKQG